MLQSPRANFTPGADEGWVLFFAVYAIVLIVLSITLAATVSPWWLMLLLGLFLPNTITNIMNLTVDAVAALLLLLLLLLLVL